MQILTNPQNNIPQKDYQQNNMGLRYSILEEPYYAEHTPYNSYQQNNREDPQSSAM